VAKKASIMKVSPPININLDKAPVDDTTHPMPSTYPRRCPSTVLSSQHHLRRWGAPICMKGPLNFQNSKQSIEFCLRTILAWTEWALENPSRALPTMHGSKNERVHQALL
jgi:hypothetical protein